MSIWSTGLVAITKIRPRETPYESAEGGYIYVNGGPYQANDQIGSEFWEIASQELIEKAVEEVETEGTIDWAPKRRDDLDPEDDYQDFEAPPESVQGALQAFEIEEILRRLEAGLKPDYGDAHELQQRQQLIDKIDALKRLLADTLWSSPGVGHNNPPPDENAPVSSEPAASEIVAEVDAAGIEIRNELATPEPDAKKVARAALRLQKCLGWIGGKLDAFADSYAKEIGKSAAKATIPAAAALAIPAVRQGLFDIVVQAAHWLSHVMTIGLPF